MLTRIRVSVPRLVLTLVPALALAVSAVPVPAQTGPVMLHPRLDVRTVVSGLSQPIAMAFLGPNDLLVSEKASGQVKRVTNGAVAGVVLDLAVNSASERGLLGMALHPDFPANPGVYVFWSESSTGADSTSLADVPLLGNRVDRFTWNGASLTFDRNIKIFRSFQADQGQPLRGNHDGGVIRFGPDRKLYVIVGDTGRRGRTQNLPNGPFGPGIPDDQFGGPEPDDAHLTGVVLRLDDDGSAPADNPFYAFGAQVGGEVGANIQKLFAYGFRNSFGVDFDPVTGDLWTQENGDDTFTELNRVLPGHNGGWVQVMGPLSRIAEFKRIETTQFGGQMQQIRWPPANIADSPEEALARLFMLPGAHYSDPEFAWRYELPPAAIGFMRGRGLGPQFENDLFIGAARTGIPPSQVPGASVISGHLFRMQLTGNRRKIAVDDPRLEDRVADNLDKHDITESESLLIGIDFGVGTDIQTAPNGNLWVVSLTSGAIYEVFRK